MAAFFLKLAFTIAAFALALHQVEWRELVEAMHRQQPLYLAASLGAIGVQTIAGGLRWHHIRTAISGSSDAARTTLIYYASSFFNVIMPSTVGSDVARGWLAKQSGSVLSDVVYGVLADRIMSLAGITLLVASTLPLLAAYLGMDPRWGLVLAVLVWSMAIACYLMLRLLTSALGSVAHVRLIGSIIHAVGKIAGKHRQVILALLWAIAAHVAYATATYALAVGLGIHISWLACLVLVPLVLFISTLPISLGGWGIREVSMATVLALAQVENAPAIVLSIQLGLMTTIVSLGGGAVYFFLKRQ